MATGSASPVGGWELWSWREGRIQPQAGPRVNSDQPCGAWALTWPGCWHCMPLSPHLGPGGGEAQKRRQGKWLTLSPVSGVCSWGSGIRG